MVGCSSFKHGHGSLFVCIVQGPTLSSIVGASMRGFVHLVYGVINPGKSFDVDIPMRDLAFQDGI
jgi:hypothetical protein